MASRGLFYFSIINVFPVPFDQFIAALLKTYWPQSFESNSTAINVPVLWLFLCHVQCCMCGSFLTVTVCICWKRPGSQCYWGKLGFSVCRHEGWRKQRTNRAAKCFN